MECLSSRREREAPGGGRARERATINGVEVVRRNKKILDQDFSQRSSVQRHCREGSQCCLELSVLTARAVAVTTRTHFTFRVDTWSPVGESIVEHVRES